MAGVSFIIRSLPKAPAFTPSIAARISSISSMLGLPRSLGSDKNAGIKTAGRNDPCQCGSGKKYKKCCLPRETAPVKRTPEDAPEEPFIAEIRPDLNEA